jgi:hypothetical protein
MRDRPLKLGVLGAGVIATADHGVLSHLGPIGDEVEVVAIADTLFDRA